MSLLLKIAGFLLLASYSLQAQTHIWTGDAGDNQWSTASNWDAGTVPHPPPDVLIGAGASVEITSGSAMAQSIDLIENASLRLTNSLEIGAMDIAENATLFFDEGSIKGIPSLITNNGTIRLEGFTTHVLEDLTIQNNNLFLVIESNQSELIDVTINNAVDAVIDIQSNGGFVDQSTNTVLNNEGVLKKSPGSTPNGNFYLIFEINNTGTIEVFENQTFLLLSGSDTFTNLEQGIIQGNGVYDITTNFTNAGTVYPGNKNQVGQLQVTNNLALNDGVIEFDINGTSTAEYDQIVMTGSPSLEGFIAINLTTSLEVDDSFELITWTTSGSSCSFPATVSTIFDGLEYQFEVVCNTNSVSLVLQGIALGIDEIDPSNVTFDITPNPIVEESRIYFSTEFSSEETISLNIYNLAGQLVDKIENVTDGMSYNRNSLSSGLYFARLEADGVVLTTQKMVLK